MIFDTESPSTFLFVVTAIPSSDRFEPWSIHALSPKMVQIGQKLRPPVGIDGHPSSPRKFFFLGPVLARGLEDRGSAILILTRRNFFFFCIWLPRNPDNLPKIRASPYWEAEDRACTFYPDLSCISKNFCINVFCLKSYRVEWRLFDQEIVKLF